MDDDDDSDSDSHKKTNAPPPRDSVASRASENVRTTEITAKTEPPAPEKKVESPKAEGRKSIA